ncbi:MAG: sulfotransferase family protein [Chloroflexota bacterium]
MPENSRRPDFFIVGAPKSGTTAMNDYLRQHPEIFMPERKDLSFFGADLQFSRPRITHRQYLALFSGAQDCRRLGETSVWYLYSRSAAQEIKAFAPQAQILIMLRNPVDMLYAQHSQFLYNCNEDLPGFAEALEAEEDRKHGRRIPRRAHFVGGLFYRETARYVEQVERYLDVFGSQQVHILLFDDFKRDTAAAYQEVLAFLGVEDSFRPAFQVVNPNKGLRSRLVQELLVAPPPVFTWVSQRVVPGPWRGRLLQRLRKLNMRRMDRPTLDLDLRRRLQADFQPEVERLARLIGRDLSQWTC